jgi:hypothetical protein
MTQAPDRDSAWPQAGVERRPFRRVVVARRVDSERPARMWSLLLPQNSDIGDQSSHAPAPRPSISRRPRRPPFGVRARTRATGQDGRSLVNPEALEAIPRVMR